MLWPRRASPTGETLAELRLSGFRVFLRPADLSDFEQWRDIRARNEARLRMVEPQWGEDALTRAYFERRLLAHDRDRRLDRAHCFFVFDRHANALIGGMNLNAVLRGAAQYCSLGYWIDEKREGQGLMTESGRLLIAHAFGTLGLSRINAACLPENQRSRQLLSRLGFEEEGFAKNYLQINGIRRDHVLYGLCASGAEG